MCRRGTRTQQISRMAQLAWNDREVNELLSYWALCKDTSDPPVEIIEEREQIEAQFAPGLLLAVIENVGVHHADRIVHDLRAIGRPVEKPGRKRVVVFAVRHTNRSYTRHLPRRRTSTDGRRAAGYLGQVWPTLRRTWTSGRRGRGWSTPGPPATQKRHRMSPLVTRLQTVRSG